jgi:hypothetical protein
VEVAELPEDGGMRDHKRKVTEEMLKDILI